MEQHCVGLLAEAKDEQQAVLFYCYYSLYAPVDLRFVGVSVGLFGYFVVDSLYVVALRHLMDWHCVVREPAMKAELFGCYYSADSLADPSCYLPVY
jgi:hypothetical protein